MFIANATIMIIIDLLHNLFIITSKMPSISRTVINAPTPALAANGVRSVSTFTSFRKKFLKCSSITKQIQINMLTDVTAIPMPNT